MKSNAVAISAAALALCMLGCAKDELVVEKLPGGSVTQHSCTRIPVRLNIDSLSHCDPWDSTMTIVTCTCDTVDLRPEHLPPDLEFDRWTIDQDGHHTSSTLFELDTLTRSAHLQIVFEHHPGDYHVQIPVILRMDACK